MAFLISHFSFLIASAQTFTQRIQSGTAGQATVTIHQSAEIDKLVNSATLTTATPRTSTGTTPTPQRPTANTQSPTPKAQTPTPDNEQEAGPVDLSKKVIRNGVKVNGYRVQAFAGGNSRKDRQQAEQIGNNIKAHYGNVPVYVHFYSPRWICRVGNYRTYEEAHQMLQNLRKLGYNQASIVKGKITVQY
jgi:hypothetical protein